MPMWLKLLLPATLPRGAVVSVGGQRAHSLVAQAKRLKLSFLRVIQTI